VDLFGNVWADFIELRRYYSGVGGQPDFIRALNDRIYGTPLIAMQSMTDKGQSKIIKHHPPGINLTACSYDGVVIVTEWGIADLRELTVGEKALALASISHPSCRDELLRYVTDDPMFPSRWVSAGKNPVRRSDVCWKIAIDEIKFLHLSSFAFSFSVPARHCRFVSNLFPLRSTVQHSAGPAGTGRPTPLSADRFMAVWGHIRGRVQAGVASTPVWSQSIAVQTSGAGRGFHRVLHRTSVGSAIGISGTMTAMDIGVRQNPGRPLLFFSNRTHRSARPWIQTGY
jgi:hypothetical protein